MANFKFEFQISGMSAESAKEFWDELLADAALCGFEVGGGYKPVDENGDPLSVAGANANGDPNAKS